MESPTIGKLSSMYMYAWKQGLKTTYYLRSRPATSIAKTTIKRPSQTAEGQALAQAAAAMDSVPTKTYSESEVLACSIENPESCEACQ
jgi:ribonucleoside-diphosphate reductase alpha chain